jgi:mannose/fructose/N-acetylgalactosamine-specific phosphotransferase system component IIC
MKNFKKPLLIIVATLGLLLFLTTTNPYEVPLAVLLIPFGLLFWLTYVVIGYVLSLVLRKEAEQDNSNKDKTRISRLNFMSAVLSSIIVLIAVLQSIQQLTVRDVLITIGLLGVTIFYIKRIG